MKSIFARFNVCATNVSGSLRYGHQWQSKLVDEGAARMECNCNSFCHFFRCKIVYFRMYARVIFVKSHLTKVISNKSSSWIAAVAATLSRTFTSGDNWHEIWCVCIHIFVVWQHSQINGKFQCFACVFVCAKKYNCLIVLLCIKCRCFRIRWTCKQRKKAKYIWYKVSFGSYILPFILFTLRFIKSEHCRREQ